MTYCGKFAKNTNDVIFKLLNTDFEVEINDVPCEVRECRVSAIPFNRPWPGKQRNYNQSESAGFISFSADEQVEIKVKRKKAFDKVEGSTCFLTLSVGELNRKGVFHLHY